MKRCLPFFILFTMMLTLLGSCQDGARFPATEPALKDLNIDQTFSGCSKVTFISRKDAKKGPACDGQCQVLADTGFLNTLFSPLGDKEDVAKAYVFLTDLRERIAANIKRNNQLTDIQLHCLEKDAPWFAQKQKEFEHFPEEEKLYSYERCPVFLELVKKSIRDIRPALRQSLALARYRILLSLWENPDPEKNINIEMDGLVGGISSKMEFLSETELQEAISTFQKDTNSLEADWKIKRPDYQPPTLSEISRDMRLGNYGRIPDEEHQKFVKNGRHEKMMAYRKNYFELLARAPILAYLGDISLQDTSLIEATKKLLANGKAAEKKFKQVSARTDQIGTINYYSEKDMRLSRFGLRASESLSKEEIKELKVKEMLPLMKYGAVVNEILEENTRHCASAVGLVSSINQTKLKNNVGLAALMIGGSAVVAVRGSILVAGTAWEGMSGAALATFAALPVSAVTYYRDYLDYKESENINFNVSETENLGKKIGDLSEFQQARSAVLFNLAVSGTGIDFWGTGLGRSAFLFTSMVASGKIFEKVGLKSALKEALVSKGKTTQEAASVLKNLTSRDPSKVTDAVKVIIQTLDLSPQELKMIRLAASREFFSESGLENLIRQLPLEPQERKIAVQKILSTLEEAEKFVPRPHSAEMIAFINSDSLPKEKLRVKNDPGYSLLFIQQEVYEGHHDDLATAISILEKSDPKLSKEEISHIIKARANLCRL